MELLISFLISIGINILLFIPAFFLRTDKVTDISYAITFVVVAMYGLYVGGITLYSLILFGMVLVWAIRLGSYLLIRIMRIKKDDRFDDKRNSFWRFGGFWLLQGFTVWVVMLPGTLFLLKGVNEIPTFAYIGIIIWFSGLLIETMADMQKYKFITNPKNKGKWIESGLWKYSRHPNYFGEILLWFGVYLYVVSSLEVWQVLVGLLGPVYIAVLIIFVSGIPLLEKAANKKWGDNDKYKEYKKRTSTLLPYIGRGGN